MACRPRTAGARERDGLGGGGAVEFGSETTAAGGMTGGSPLSATAVPRGRGNGPTALLGRLGSWAADRDAGLLR
jgi:hypothetical protein